MIMLTIYTTILYSARMELKIMNNVKLITQNNYTAESCIMYVISKLNEQYKGIPITTNIDFNEIIFDDKFKCTLKPVTLDIKELLNKSNEPKDKTVYYLAEGIAKHENMQTKKTALISYSKLNYVFVQWVKE
jgi:hypothetical protein